MDFSLETLVKVAVEDECCLLKLDPEYIYNVFNTLNEILVAKTAIGRDASDSHFEESCGYIFQRGDLIYRCKTCTDDETCVLCASCFQDIDHVDHEFYYSLSNGSGGSCDCGEDESWNQPLSCPIHKIVHFSEACTKANEGHLMFSEILNHSAKILTQDLFSLSNSHQSSNGNDVLVLFNDEKHSYADVINILMEAGLPEIFSRKDAEYFAETIDKHVSPKK